MKHDLTRDDVLRHALAMRPNEMKASMHEVYANTLGAISGMADAWLTGGAVVRAAYGAPESPTPDIDVITADYDDAVRALTVDGWTKISEKLPGEDRAAEGSGASTARVSRWTHDFVAYALDLLELPTEKDDLMPFTAPSPEAFLRSFLARFDLSICQVAVRGDVIVWGSETARADFFEGVIRVMNDGWDSTAARIQKYRTILAAAEAP